VQSGDVARTPDQLQTLHSIPAVAQRLNVSEKSVRRFIERGLLRAYKIGGQIRISEEDLLAYQASSGCTNRISGWNSMCKTWLVTCGR
jgi:excisionase family DNA binding protein